MSDLVPLNPRSLSRGESRELSRIMGTLEARTSMETTRIDLAADLQAAKVDALAYVGRRAMQDIARLTQLEQQLVLMVPMASGRLQAIGDLTALAVTEVVTDTLRKVR